MKTRLSKGKDSIRLTSRDLEMFHLIHSQGAKTSGDLSAQFWNEKSRKAHAGFQRIRKLVAAELFIRGNPKLLYLSDIARALIQKNQTTSGVVELEKHD